MNTNNTDNLYFAYGSNLNFPEAEKRGLPKGSLTPVSPAFLPDVEIVFNYHSQSRNGGALNLRQRVGQVTEGILFQVAEGGWAALDKKEGVSAGCYERRSVTCITADGQELPATTYIVRPERREKSFVPPTPEYINIVREGLEYWNLSTEALDAVAKGEQAPLQVNALFTYGTLMRGECRFPVLQPLGIECVILAETKGLLYDLGAYPGMTLADSDAHRVQGEFVRIRNLDQALEELDQIEGFAGIESDKSLFRRTIVPVGVGDGRVRLAWTYVYSGSCEQASQIDSGDWREHRGTRAEFIEQLVDAHANQDRHSLAKALLTQTIPHSDAHGKHLIECVQDLRSAVLTGGLSERALAQASGNWCAGT